MSFAWIVCIRNQSNSNVIFRQSDPDKHPVINSSQNVTIIEQNVVNPSGGIQVQSGNAIQIGPGGMLTAS
jgi:hypothetical protein